MGAGLHVQHGLWTASSQMGQHDAPEYHSYSSFQRLFFFFFFFVWVTGELSTLCQLMKVPNEPGLSPNNGLEHVPLSDQSMASNPRKGQAKYLGAKRPAMMFVLAP